MFFFEIATETCQRHADDLCFGQGGVDGSFELDYIFVEESDGETLNENAPRGVIIIAGLGLIDPIDEFIHIVDFISPLDHGVHPFDIKLKARRSHRAQD